MSEIEKAKADMMRIPRKLLEEIAEGDEAALSGTARVQLAFIMEQMTMRCVDPATSPTAIASIMEVLRKISQGQKAEGPAGGPQVVINISRARDRSEGITIEGNGGNKLVAND